MRDQNRAQPPLRPIRPATNDVIDRGAPDLALTDVSLEEQPPLIEPQAAGTRSNEHALQVLLEKYPIHDLREALMRAQVETNIFTSFALHGGRPHAQVVFDLIAELARRGWLAVRSAATRQLLQALVELRPGLYREISVIATKHFAINIPPIDPDYDEPTAVRVRPEMLAGNERRRLVDDLQRLTVQRSNLAENTRASEELRLKVNDIARELHATGGVRRGQLVAGTILEDVVASGSFGTVWKARSATNGQPRATKVFHLDKLTQGLMLARFRQSIDMIRLLTNDPHCPTSIVKIHHVSDDGLAFAMDYASCGSLESLRKYEWNLPTILDRFRKICEACHFAHEKGIIHRDIKPNNVLLDADLQPILIDFDISDATTSRIAYLGASTQGWLGTPVFGSPEQLSDARVASRQSDVFSLGRLLHFMLLRGTSPGMLTAHEPDLEDLSSFPATIVQIVRTATRYDPRRRYASVKEIINDIDRYRTGWAAVRVSAQRAARWFRRHRATSAAVSALAALAIGLWRYADLMERQRMQHTIDILQSDCAMKPCSCPDVNDPTPGWMRSAIELATAFFDVLPEDVARPAPSPTPTSEPRVTVVPEGEVMILEDIPVPRPDPRPRTNAPSRVGEGNVSAPDSTVRSATQAVEEATRTISVKCAEYAWPMLRFTLALRAQDGRITATRKDSNEWHPAVLCAIKVLADIRFTNMDLERGAALGFDLINPGAAAKYVEDYRALLLHTAKAQGRRSAAKQAQAGDKAAHLYGEAQHENIRAGKGAAELAERIFERRGERPTWRVDYADVSRRAVRSFLEAEVDKRGQVASRPPKDSYDGCSRDLHDVWQIAQTASVRLRDSHDLEQFFATHAQQYSRYENPEFGCSPDE